MSANGFKPSGRASAVGFDTSRPRYVEHPRSRWYGTPYWLVTNPAAIPASVRAKGERYPKMTPKTIAALIEPQQEALEDGRALEVREWSGPVRQSNHYYKDTFLYAPHLDGLWRDSLIAVGVNAHYFAWINRHTEPGEWWLLPGGERTFKTVKRKLVAVLMPVRIEDVLQLHGLEVVPVKENA